MNARDDRTLTHTGGAPAERRIVAFWDGGSAVAALPSSGRMSLGRGAGCDLVIDAASVSRIHATLTAKEDRLTLEDLDSSNGTFVNDRRLAPREQVRLGAGDTVRLGSVTVLVGGSASSGADAPAAAGTPNLPVTAATAPTVAVDPGTQEVFRLARAAAAGRISVLIVGETGVGKERVAELVHTASARSAGPFTRLNCAAIPENLFESTLFGAERGAFTGATAAKAGALEATDGGTLFLDEVSEIPLACQAKLLRALESGEVLRVGSFSPRTVDVRYVAATNRDPAELVSEGGFREDLLYRLNGLTIRVPPLRERPLDLEPLAQQMLAELSGGRQGKLSDAVLQRLRQYSWPGNVRQLRNVVERAVLMAGGQPVGVEHLPVELEIDAAGAPPSTSLRADLGSLERARIIEALEACGGNQTRAAQMLGMPRRTLVSRIEAHGIPRPRKGK